MNKLEEVRRAWDREAASFDQDADHGLRDPHVRDAWRTLLLESLPPAPARVVDLGCGTGSLSVLLAENGYDVHGVDLSDEMVKAARAKAQTAGVSATLAQGDAGEPGLTPGSFDVVLCRHVLWALPDPDESLVRRHRSEVVVRHLVEPDFWGRKIDDERYLLVSTH